MRNTLLLALASLVLGSCALEGDAPQPAPEGRPGLVLIVVDTLRADHVLGEERPCATPALDALAAQSVVFEHARSHAPLTLPSHLALFSSRLPSFTGTTLNGQPVDAGLPLLHDHLGAQGWDTQAVVSIGALRPRAAGAGVDRGFAHYDVDIVGLPNAEHAHRRLEPVLDELEQSEAPFFLFAHYADPHMPLHAHGTARTELTLSHAGEPVARFDVADLALWEHALELPAEGLQLDVSIEEGAAFSAQLFQATRDGERLEVRLSGAAFNEPTEQLQLHIANPDGRPGEVQLQFWVHEVVGPEEMRRRYALEVEYVDRWLGELVDALRARGLWEDSVVVFTSDHGEGLGDHGDLGHGKTVWEEQVPLCVRLPERYAQQADALRARAAAPVGHIDLAPTLLDLLELPPLPGQSGLSLLSDTPALHFAEAWNVGLPRVFSANDGRWKLHYSPDLERFLLYDLERDPGELNDLYESEGERFATRAATLREHAERALLREEIFEQQRAAGGALSPELEAELRALGY